MQNVPTTQNTSTLALVLYFTFKTIPVLVSALAIYLGYLLFILGVTGKASLSVESETVKGQLINAAPGLFFAVGGITALIIIVWKGVKIGFNKNGLIALANERMIPETSLSEE